MRACRFRRRGVGILRADLGEHIEPREPRLRLYVPAGACCSVERSLIEFFRSFRLSFEVSRGAAGLMYAHAVQSAGEFPD